MPEQQSLAELARQITAGAVRLSAATAAWLELVAEFDARQGWAGYGIRSCAEWLAWQCGLSPGPAREHVRVARALRALPVLAGAFRAGRLSYSKLRALTRVAEPATEAYLLDFALQATASQVERTVRQWRRADRDDAETEQARQRIDWWWDEQGMLVLKTRLAPELGAALIAAIESRVEREPAATAPPPPRQPAAGRPAGGRPRAGPANEMTRTTPWRAAASAPPPAGWPPSPPSPRPPPTATAAPATRPGAP